jgi:hypothetical protein
MAKTANRFRHGLANDNRPAVLIRSTGERVMAQSELAQLQDKREKLQAQLNELDDEILAMKNKRKEELMAELKELGLDLPRLSPSSNGDGKRKGRPKGFKMSEEHKQALRDGRAKARASREGKTDASLL